MTLRPTRRDERLDGGPFPDNECPSPPVEAGRTLTADENERPVAGSRRLRRPRGMPLEDLCAVRFDRTNCSLVIAIGDLFRRAPHDVANRVIRLSDDLEGARVGIPSRQTRFALDKRDAITGGAERLIVQPWG